MKLPMIEHDKANHLIYGVLIFICVYLISNEYIALLITSLIGAGKEFLDYRDKANHTSSLLDFIYTFVGGCLCFILIIISKIKPFIYNIFHF